MSINLSPVASALAIYKAALHDDWDSVSFLFDHDPNLLTAPVAPDKEPPLNIAVGTNSSHRFVERLVERIVADDSQKDKLFKGNTYKNNPLHYAAKVGNMRAAKLLVQQNPDMTRVENAGKNGPMKLAAWHGNKEMLRYLLTVTPDEPLGDEGSQYTGRAGGDLITLTIMAGFYDVALEIINKKPSIVLEADRKGQTALQRLAQKPEIFPSGSRLGFWGRFICSLMPTPKDSDLRASQSLIINKFTTGFWSALQYMAPSIKNLHDIKVNIKLSSLLVDRICNIVMAKGDTNLGWKIFGSAIATSIKYGTHEIIEKCILAYPGMIWYKVDGYYFWFEAIKQRQERVYNLLYQMTRHRVLISTQTGGGKENALHIAARLAPPQRLNVVTGAALQMQREIQWFQEIKKFVDPSYREDENKDGDTPRKIFTEAHKELLKEGQQWMKDTASSCTVVAALIVTMAFAAAFTVPGGNQDNGLPLFQDKKTFMLFVVSDAVALFSSSTSVLMFLGILTSRYAEDDFLYALPKRLAIGLISLFMSLAATMIAFSSVLALVLQDKVTWIAAPLVIATSIPVSLFGMLQFPLLVEIFKSTYGRSIFHQQSDRMLH